MLILLAVAALALLLSPAAPTLFAPACSRTRPRRGTPPRLRAAASRAPAAATAPLAVLVGAAETKQVADDDVVAALLALEKEMRVAAKDDDGALSASTLEALDGAWRLVFTTGTVDQQKRTGSINYFPIKAVQTFDTTAKPMAISNGIYLGDFALLRFFGAFEWDLAARRLEFDFESIAVLGFRFDLPKGGAAEIGASTGLGAEGNVKRAQQGKKAFFNWISADEKIATARGGGGGLALWRRVTEVEA